MAKKIKPITSANTKLLNKNITHSHRVVSYANNDVSDVMKHLTNDVIPDLRGQIYEYGRLGKNVARQKQIEKNIAKIIDKGAENVSADFVKELDRFAKSEVAAQVKFIQDSVPVQFSLDTPNINLLKANVRNNPFEGEILKGWFDDWENSTIKTITRELRIGVSQGESIAQMTKRIMGSGASKNFAGGTWRARMAKAEGFVRTAVNNTSNIARQMTYDENSEVIKGIMYVATLDNRTTLICANLDGQVFPIDSGPRPPQHFGCRSTTSPVLKSWKELGIDLKEAPPGTRQSMDGSVPDKMTYKQWFETDPETGKRRAASWQREILGPTKYELKERFGIPIDKFTNDVNNKLTIPEILEREGIDKEDLFTSKNIKNVA